MRRPFLTVFEFLFLIPVVAYAVLRISGTGELIDAIRVIAGEPRRVTVQFNGHINNRGGHLQGIQFLSRGMRVYYVLTGSSGTYSYYAVLKGDGEPSVITVKKILDKPFKHAGGFQISHNLMAVGVEDNSARKCSRVFIFRIEDPEKPPENPLAVIERKGEYERATAGCTAIVEKGGKVLVVVGDWDTRHLDFYTIGKNELMDGNGQFELKASVDTGQTDRSGWVDKRWYAYQNINLLKDRDGLLYMAGMASSAEDRNVLDLYELKINDWKDFRLIKVYSKMMDRKDYAGFNWGAGIYMTDEGTVKIISCGPHIRKCFAIGVYE
jgi:hypothetical protein